MSSSTEIEISNTENNNEIDSVASRKLAAAEYRRARKAARDPRNRLFSDSSDEAPKGILKNARIPTKRSVSECVDDLSQIMADLDLNIHDFPKATGRFCLHQQYFDEKEEDKHNDCVENLNDKSKTEKKIKNSWKGSKKNTKCDCNFNGDINKDKLRASSGGDEYREDDDEEEEKPKKSVRFDEKVYETVFFASRLYDRRYFSKYHFSTRHHPQSNHKQNNNNKSNNKKNRQRSKSESDGDLHRSFASLKSDNSCNGRQLSKSQRAKQSKKDKKKRFINKKEDSTDTNSDDQGYYSHSFSD